MQLSAVYKNAAICSADYPHQHFEYKGIRSDEMEADIQ